MKCPACGSDAAGKFCSHCGAALEGVSCPICGAPLSSGARFCHVCGRPLAATRRPAARSQTVAWVTTAVAVTLLVVVLLTRSSSSIDQGGVRRGASPSIAGGGERGGASPSIPGAGPGGAATTDISQMTPRERADRLFNRVMTGSENGNHSEVSFFGPMALQAYAMLGKLDPDARYHVGLIDAAIENPAAASAQADSLETEAPHHLFVPLLRWEVANRRKDTAAMRRAYRQFLERYDQEMASGRPEYHEHRGRLESFREEARGAVSRTSS